MNKLFAFLLIISFLFIAIFAGAMITDGHMRGSCIFSALAGGDCPQGASPIYFINFHANLLQQFSLFVFPLAAFAALIFLALSAFRFRDFDPWRQLHSPSFSLVPIADDDSETRLTRWSSLFEHSPPNRF